MAQLLLTPTENAVQYTLDAQLAQGETSSLTLNQDVSGIVQGPGVCVVDRIDSSENETPSKREYIKFTGVSTNQLTGLTRAQGGSTDQVHAVSAIVEFIPDVVWAQSIYDVITEEHETDGTHSAGVIDTAELADGAVETAKIEDANVTTAKLADEAVTNDKIEDTASWKEIGRTTLGSAGDTITVDSLPARKYLKILVMIIPSGSVVGNLQFNGDSTLGNYHRRFSANMGATTSQTDQSRMTINTNAGSLDIDAEIRVSNIATRDKLIQVESAYSVDTGDAVTMEHAVGKWINNTDQITRVDVLNGSTGDFAIGSEVVVLGRD